MSVQRRSKRHAQRARVYQTREIRDTRNNTQIVVDMDHWLDVTAAFIPQRASRGEVPGQIETNVVRMILDHDLPEVNLWSRVWWRGAWWDVEAPPVYHHGTRHVRHWSMDIRRRPGTEVPPAEYQDGEDQGGEGEGEADG